MSATAKRRQRLPFWQQTPISLRRALTSARSLVRVKFPSPTTYYYIVAVPFPPPTDKQTASLLDMNGLAAISLSSPQAVFDARIDQRDVFVYEIRDVHYTAMALMMEQFPIWSTEGTKLNCIGFMSSIHFQFTSKRQRATRDTQREYG